MVHIVTHLGAFLHSRMYLQDKVGVQHFPLNRSDQLDKCHLCLHDFDLYRFLHYKY